MRCAIANSAQQGPPIQWRRWPSWRQVENQMLLIVGAIFVLIAAVVILRIRVPGGVNASTLGWMSDKWLAEHRASHSR